MGDIFGSIGSTIRGAAGAVGKVCTPVFLIGEIIETMVEQPVDGGGLDREESDDDIARAAARARDIAKANEITGEIAALKEMLQQACDEKVPRRIKEIEDAIQRKEREIRRIFGISN